jgi:hypothetical protein|tara:strand:- start:2088 stop:4508 length:2421 start_codon:yes stop_codon:yes gene_type:complete
MGLVNSVRNQVIGWFRATQCCVAFLSVGLPVTISAAPGLDLPAVISIPRFNQSEIDIRVDGRLDEEIWESVPYHDQMTVSDPDRGEPGRFRTHTRLLHTERGLYVSVWNEQPPETLLGRLSSRDSFMTRDGYQIVIDTSGEGLYGYWFQVNLGGSLGDGIVLPERNFQRNWDGAWHGAAAETEDGWTLEMFLPWGIMNMPESVDGPRRMGVSGSRRLGQLNERWSWPYLPFTQPRFMSSLQPIDVVGVNPRQEYSVYPYLSASQDGARDESAYKAGIDMFWRPSANLQMNATLNPDFGQVEADDVVVNFTSFETFFPEKRLFFLENQDIFMTGSGNTALLHTRRIGSSVSSRRGSPDAIDGISFESFDVSQPVDLAAALKTTGQTGKLRYGFLAAVEEDTPLDVVSGVDGDIEAPGREFGVVRLSYEDASRGGRRALGWIGTLAHHPNRRAVAHGIDGHLLSVDGKLEADGQMLYSDTEGSSGFGILTDFSYTPRRGDQHSLSVNYMDDELDINDVGFLNRNDLLAISYGFSRRETNVERLRQRDTSLSMNGSFNTDDRFLGGRVRVRQRWRFNNNARLSASIYYRPMYWDDRDSRDNGDFRRNARWATGIDWNTDFAKPVVYGFGVDLNQESEGGLSRRYSSQIFLRPSDRLSLGLTTRYSRRDAWLIHVGGREFTAFESEQWQPSVSVSMYFSARQQLRMQLQWVAIKAVENERWQVPLGGGDLDEVERAPGTSPSDFAISDITVQFRYRWQIAPLSDLFVVYNRGGGLADASIDDSFGSLFSDAFSDPQREFLVVKLRYRFGS